MRGFNGDNIQPIRVIGQIGPRPLLLIHGTADAHISWRQSQALFQAAGEPKTLWLVDGAHHGDARLSIRRSQTMASNTPAFNQRCFC